MRLEDRPFTTGDVSRYTQMPNSVLQYYSSQGLIQASVREAAGPGRKRYYSFRDMVLLAHAREMRRYEVPLVIVAAVLKFLRETPDLTGLTVTVVNADGDVRMADYSNAEETLSELVRRGAWLQLPSGMLVGELRRQIEEDDQLRFGGPGKE